jgi:hypothetical protein
MDNGCVDCETKSVAEFNGRKVCAHHLELEGDMSAREAPPIARAPFVKCRPLLGTSSHGTPRHYK